jgi:hypothetical protein
VIEGADHGRFVVARWQGLPEGSIARIVPINGPPGLIVYAPDGSVQSVAFESSTTCSSDLRGEQSMKLSTVPPV